MKKLYLSLSLILVFLVLFSCEKANPLDAGGWYCVTGDKIYLSVTLPYQPATGYVWRYEIEGESLRKDSTYLRMGNYQSEIGPASAWMATFSGGKAGESTIRFVYEEKEHPENVRYTATLTVASDKKKRLSVLKKTGDSLPQVMDSDE
ncbi:MAG: protease inhibitor I42 family protein [Spirochaetales bacterium]|nr:protease inhibitor I42 family protein [Candidatus Physcosoma equi]